MALEIKNKLIAAGQILLSDPTPEIAGRFNAGFRDLNVVVAGAWFLEGDVEWGDNCFAHVQLANGIFQAGASIAGGGLGITLFTAAGAPVEDTVETAAYVSVWQLPHANLTEQ